MWTKPKKLIRLKPDPKKCHERVLSKWHENQKRKWNWIRFASFLIPTECRILDFLTPTECQILDILTPSGCQILDFWHPMSAKLWISDALRVPNFGWADVRWVPASTNFYFSFASFSLKRPKMNFLTMEHCSGGYSLRFEANFHFVTGSL